MSHTSESSAPIEPQDEHNQESPVAESNGFQFLTFTAISEIRDPKTKKKVRSHVMQRVQRNLRNDRQQERERVIVLDIAPLSQGHSGPSRDSANSMLGLPSQSYLHDLGAGRSDPFVRYPIDMDIRTHELFDHLHGRTCPMFKTLNKIGFFKTALDEAAFRQILCTSSSHMMKLRGGNENAEAITLSTEAIRSINRRIADPVLGISDGVIVTISAFACHAVMFNDLHGTLTHFNGLQEILRRRGGLEALRSSPVMRTVLCWIDVNTAFLHDRVPRFPIPDDILPRINSDTSMVLPDLTLLGACLTDAMVSAINDLLFLNQFIIREQALRDVWDDGVFAGLHVVPFLSNLLSIRYESGGSNPAFKRQESCRIGAILYLAGIRQRFGVNLASGVYILKLKDAIIGQEDLTSEESDPILLWLLVIGGVQSRTHVEHEWFVSATASLIMRRQLSMWEELMEIVHGVLWIDGIFQVECDKFHSELSSEAWNKFGHILS